MSVSLSVCQSGWQYISQFSSMSVMLPVCQSLSLLVYQSVSMPVNQYVSVPIVRFQSVTLSISVCSSGCQSFDLSVFQNDPRVLKGCDICVWSSHVDRGLALRARTTCGCGCEVWVYIYTFEVWVSGVMFGCESEDWMYT